MVLSGRILGGAAALLALGCASCSGRQASSAPPLGPARQVAAGVNMHEVTLEGVTQPIKVRVYLPTTRAGDKLPCVFVAPAGSRLIHGMRLADEDSPEHIPYAQAGFVVVAYELEGPVGPGDSEANLVRAIRAFKDAEGGVADARRAIDYALKVVPGIDPARLYTAGHSSAANVSLLVAAKDKRIAACIAYAPVGYLSRWLPAEAVETVGKEVPGFQEFLKAISPAANAADIKCPTFIFHADDDSVVPLSDNTDFVAALKQTNPHVTFDRVPTGDHHDSMIEQGIPHAITWLKNLPHGAK